MSRFEKVDDGWYLLDGKGRRLRRMESVCFLVDKKHDLALFPGTEEDVDVVVDRLRRKCSLEYRDRICKACLGTEVDELEASFMLDKCRAPRRVSIRMKRKGA